jgi:hypothetical protein
MGRPQRLLAKCQRSLRGRHPLGILALLVQFLNQLVELVSLF